MDESEGEERDKIARGDAQMVGKSPSLPVMSPRATVCPWEPCPPSAMQIGKAWHETVPRSPSVILKSYLHSGDDSPADFARMTPVKHRTDGITTAQVRPPWLDPRGPVRWGRRCYLVLVRSFTSRPLMPYHFYVGEAVYNVAESIMTNREASPRLDQCRTKG